MSALDGIFGLHFVDFSTIYNNVKVVSGSGEVGTFVQLNSMQGNIIYSHNIDPMVQVDSTVVCFLATIQ